jgi:hypothetical protein
METEMAKLDNRGQATDFARGSLRAVGTGHLRFAYAEPGLFRTAFSPPAAIDANPDPAKAGDSGLNPFQLLSAALNRMVDAKLLPAERRPGAEYLAWSAVHGLALLFTDGLMRNAAPAYRDAIGQLLLDMAEKGL